MAGGRPAELNATAASLLGFLHEGPMTGWDLVATAQRRIGDFWSLTQSQVYRELSGMAGAGLVEAGERGARDRRPYRLTEAGRRAFAAWIARPPGPETIRFPLLLTVLFGGHVPPERLAKKNNFIDEQVFAKLKALRIEPSDLCRDAEFQRRAHLDTIGVLPTPAEVKAFLADLLICGQATLNSLRRVRERWRDSRACLTLHRSRREMLLQLLTNHFDSITHRSQFGCGYSTTHVTETAVGHHQ